MVADPADEAGWCLTTLHDFTGDPDNDEPAPFGPMGLTDDGYLYLPYGNPARINLTDFSQEFGVPSGSALFALGALFQQAFAGAPAGMLYALARTTDDPRTPQIWSWTEAGGWVWVADLDIGWTAHALAYGRDSNLYALERITNGTTIQWLPSKDRNFAASYDWVVAGSGWSTSTIGGRLYCQLTSAPSGADLTVTFPATIVPVDAGDSFTFRVGVAMRDSGGSFEVIQPTVTVQLTRDGAAWGTPASESISGTIVATGSNPGAGHTVGAVITVHDNGAGTTVPVCYLEIDNLSSFGLIETYGGATTHRAAKITTSGTVTTLTALDYARTGFNDYRSITADSTGLVWISMDHPPSGGPDIGVNTALRQYDPAGPTVTDVGIQPIVDFGNDGNSEAYGAIFCDNEDHVLVPMVRYTSLNQSWYLRVSPAGVATRIASTWSDSGAPPPALTATNIVNGGLGTSLANEADQGWGISLDGETLYFFDNVDQTNSSEFNLLRTLGTHCNCPFKYPYYWPQFYADLLSGDGRRVREAEERLVDRDRALENHIRSRNGGTIRFDFPHTWHDILPKLLARDAQALAWLTDNDRAIEDRRCSFRYPWDWMAVAGDLTSGDAARAARAAAQLDDRDRALEDNFTHHPCSC